MLNKKLIAGSIFALMSAPALAVPSFTYTADSVSNQGAASLDMLTLNTVTITSGAEYSDDDLIVLDYNVALGSDYTPASTLSMYATCVDGAVSPATITGSSAENGGELTLGLLSTDAAAGSITYRVTDVSYAVTSAGGGDAALECVSSNNSSVGAVVAVAGVKVDGAAALAAGSVTGTYHATLPNGSTDIDGGSTSITFGLGTTPETYAKLATFGDQFTDPTGNTALSGTIDVAAADPRSLFDGGGSTATGVVTLADATGMTSNADITGITFSLNGDFSYLVDEDADTPGIQNDAWSLDLNIDAAGDEVYEATTVTASKITWVVTETSVPAALDRIDDIAIDFDNAANGPAGDVAMIDGAYTYDVTIAYTDGGVLGNGADGVAGSFDVTAGGAAGEFDLNGSKTTIKNYPLSSAVTQFVWVTNKGTQDGGIFATAFGGTGGQTMASCDLGVTSKAGEIQRITDELNACLADASMTAGRAQIVVTVNAISTDIGIYAGYKHDADADRLNLTQ
jgi:hypothetical protein